MKRRERIVAERIAEEIHSERFAKSEGRFKGPDTFYAGMLYAEQIACVGHHSHKIHEEAAWEMESR